MDIKYVLLGIAGLLSAVATVYATEGRVNDMSIGYYLGIGITILIIIYFHNKFKDV